MVLHVKGSLRLAPALIQMEAEANRLAPNRSKISDGSFPSAAHTAANPTSDHEVGDALDLTTDPAHGWDMAERFRLIVARRDPRVKYLIHNGTIWKSYPNHGLPPWTPQVYTGTNAHKSHGHTSVLHEHRDDTSPWWPELDEEDDMTPEQAGKLDAVVLNVADAKARLERLEQRVGTDNTGRDLSDEMDAVIKALRVLLVDNGHDPKSVGL